MIREHKHLFNEMRKCSADVIGIIGEGKRGDTGKVCVDINGGDRRGCSGQRFEDLDARFFLGDLIAEGREDRRGQDGGRHIGQQRVDLAAQLADLALGLRGAPLGCLGLAVDVGIDGGGELGAHLRGEQRADIIHADLLDLQRGHAAHPAAAFAVIVNIGAIVVNAGITAHGLAAGAAAQQAGTQKIMMVTGAAGTGLLI